MFYKYQLSIYAFCLNCVAFGYFISEAFELLFELDSPWQLKVILDKYLSKSMRGVNMTLQRKMSEENIAKKV